MKLHYVVVCITCLSFVSLAQIPNAGFEQWTGSEPTGWATSNAAPVANPVTASSSAHSGSWAVRGDVVNLFSVPYPPTIQSGSNARGFSVSQRHANLTGYYIFNPVGGDRFTIDVGMYRNGVGIGIGAAALPTQVASYTQFSVPINYSSQEIPDTCIIQISIGGPTIGTDIHVGSNYLLDDLAFLGTNSVGRIDQIPAVVSLEQNYPNPFNPSTKIRFHVAGGGLVSLKVFDVSGREVAMLVNENLHAGTHETTFDAKELAGGMYFYQLRAGEICVTRRLLLLR